MDKDLERNVAGAIRRWELRSHLWWSFWFGVGIGVLFGIFARWSGMAYAAGGFGRLNPRLDWLEMAGSWVYGLVFTLPPFCLISVALAGYLSTRLAVYWSDARGWKTGACGWFAGAVGFTVTATVLLVGVLWRVTNP